MTEYSPKASVIVPTYGRTAALSTALRSLLKQKLSLDLYEIIVVDNKSGSGVKQVVKELACSSPCHLCCVQELKTGLHHARHKGAEIAKGEILVYVDDDVEVPENWLSSVINCFADPTVSIVGGEVRAKWETKLPHWLSEFPTEFFSLLYLGDEKKDLHWPEIVFGCNMAIRRAALYELGGFNPDAMGDKSLIWLRGDGETGLQEKAYRAGCRIIYEPKAWLWHVIDSNRLNLNYLRWRFFIQGISDSYSQLRRESSLFAMLRHSVRCIFNFSFRYLCLLKRSDSQMVRTMEISYWFGRTMHHLRTCFSPKLKAHVLRYSYLKP